jgi:hypothetical protein
VDVLTDYLGKVPTELHGTVRHLDAVVRAAVPELVPAVKWGNLTYAHEKMVCAIVSHRAHVNLQVWGGAALPDPHRLLEGTGKVMRHVKVVPGAPLNEQAIAALVEHASAAVLA